MFIFFGWFKETELKHGILKYKRNAPDLHIIFGYLQIGSIYHDIFNLPKEMQYHPHAQRRFVNDKNNCIYRASKTLSFSPSISGGGCLNFHNDLVLTKKGYSKSKWDLPSFFRNVDMSYHTRKSFIDDYFQSAAKGQEFVIEEYNDITDWAMKLIRNGTKS